MRLDICIATASEDRLLQSCEWDMVCAVKCIFSCLDGIYLCE